MRTPRSGAKNAASRSKHAVAGMPAGRVILNHPSAIFETIAKVPQGFARVLRKNPPQTRRVFHSIFIFQFDDLFAGATRGTSCRIALGATRFSQSRFFRISTENSQTARRDQRAEQFHRPGDR